MKGNLSPPGLDVPIDIAQDLAKNSLWFSSILHILREIIFIVIFSLHETGEINRVREKDGVFAGN